MGPGFASKDEARRFVWDRLQSQKVARFPFPPHGRIPNFADAGAAARKLFDLPLLLDARRIKVNPDAPQRYVRELPSMDVVVVGSVAVTPDGRRCGKGHGYADLEYAILRELGHPAAPVLTTVHPLQIVRDFPADRHDLPVSVIVTPESIHSVENPPPPPGGIDWDLLDAAALEEMPVLAELRGCRNPRGRSDPTGSP